MALDTIITFTAASVLLAIAPGPDNIFVLTQSAMNGTKSGIFITLGLCTGLIMHTTLVALGVSVIFKVNITAFTILKSAGACYLLYLAWHAIKAGPADLEGGPGRKNSFFSLYKKGIIMNITNPKVAIFFMAFLPQFTDTSRGSVTFQMIILGLIFIVSALTVFSTIAVLSGYLRSWLIKSHKSQLVINKIAGTVFISLAIKLLISDYSK